MPVPNANSGSPADSPPEKRARLEPTNFGQHEPRGSNFTSSPWKNSSSPSQPQLCRSGSFSTRDDSPNHHGRSGPMKNEPRNLIVTPDKDYGSPRDGHGSESLHCEEFDELRRRHDESTFFAGESRNK